MSDRRPRPGLRQPGPADAARRTAGGAPRPGPRRIEVWFHRVDGQVYLSTTPARRSWYANLLADPIFIFHLKHGVQADLTATGTAVHDQQLRRHVFSQIIDDLNQTWNPAGIRQPVEPLDAWLCGSPWCGSTSTTAEERTIATSSRLRIPLVPDPTTISLLHTRIYRARDERNF